MLARDLRVRLLDAVVEYPMLQNHSVECDVLVVLISSVKLVSFIAGVGPYEVAFEATSCAAAMIGGGRRENDQI